MRRTRTMTLTVAAGALLLGLTTVSATAQTPVMPHHAPVTARPSASTLPPVTVSATSVKAGQVVTVSGSDCAPQTASGPGAVEVDLTTASGTLLSSAYVSAISSNSTWSTPVTVPAPTKAGSYQLAATCDEYTTSTSYTPVSITVTATKVTTWTIQQPAFQAVPNGSFSAISCPHGATTWCMAVGNYDNAAGIQVPLTSIWNGATWTPTPLTPPTGATSSGLTSVSCTSATQCVAVGTYAPTSGSVNPLPNIYNWNGSTWKSSALPLPASSTDPTAEGVSCVTTAYCVIVGSGAEFTGVSWVGSGSTWKVHQISTASTNSTNLAAVQCVNSTWCVAVGSYFDSDYNTRALVETWNGSSWSRRGLAETGSDAPLKAVACLSTTSCVAVGGQSTPLVATLTGSSWTESQPNSNQNGQLNAVACPVTAGCIAGGSGSSGALSYQQTSTGWRSVTIPHSVYGEVDGISCSAASQCIGVGTDEIGTLSADWNGSSWSTLTANDLTGAPAATLSGVSCPTNAACTAVGSQTGVNSAQTPVVTSSNGPNWSFTGSPEPSGADSAELNDISCTATANCVAVGDYTVGTTERPYVATERSGSWSSKALPLASGDHTNTLNAVECLNASYCYAVGNSNSNNQGTSYLWNGSTWSAEKLPKDFQATSVTCAATSACLAVGPVVTVSGNVYTFTPASVEWNGSKWMSENYPSPQQYDFPDGVTCTAPTSCIAVGNSNPNVNDGDSGSDVWNGTQWSAVAAPDPAPSGSYLDSVSCATGQDCTAVGVTHGGNLGYSFPLIETWNGGSWTQLSLPSAVTNLETDLESVSCAPAATTCVAVGYGGFALRSGS